MLLLRLCFLAVYSAATNIYVVPAKVGDIVNPGAGLGTASNPFNSLVQAFLSIKAAGSYTVYLGFSGTDEVMVFSNDPGKAISASSSSTAPAGGTAPPPNLSLEPSTNWPKSTSVVVTSWLCTMDNSNSALVKCNSSISWTQTISWIDYSVKFLVMNGNSLQWSNVNFTGEKLVVLSCTSSAADEYCRHCYMENLLFSTPGSPTKLSATSHSFTLPDPTIDTILDYNKVCSARDTAVNFLFSLETVAGALTFTDVTFREFRTRLPSIINVYMGILTLTRVNFMNMEPGISGVSTLEAASSNLIAAAIITATVLQTSPGSSNPESYCQYGLAPPLNQFKPCPIIIWDTGTVSGLNRDYNYAQDTSLDSLWSGVIAAVLAQSITITNVDFHDNFAPISDKAAAVASFPGALINIAHAGEVSITSCSFTRNMAKKGMIYIQMSRKYVSNYNVENVVLTDLDFTYSFSSFAPTSITITSLDNINVKISSCTFKYGHGTNSAGTVSISSSSIDPNDLKGYSAATMQYKHPLTNTNYDISPLAVTLTDLIFDTNYNGESSASGLILQQLAGVTITSCTFKQMKEHGADILTTYSNWEYLKNINLIQGGAMPMDNKKITTKGVVSISTVLGLTISTCTFANNIAGVTPVLVANSYSSLSIITTTFTSNTSQSQNAIVLQVQLCPLAGATYIELKGCTFTSNTVVNNAQTQGVVYANNVDCTTPGFTFADAQRVRLTSPVFINNSGGLSVEGSELAISYGQFTSIISANSPAVKFTNARNKNSTDMNKLTITDSIFTGNTITAQGGADIYIGDSSNSQQTLILKISSSTFTGSTGQKAASIQMDGNIALAKIDNLMNNVQNTISSCKFSGMSTASGNGVISTAFQGILIISSTTFSNIKSTTIENASCIYAQHQPNLNREDSTKAETYLMLSDVTITGSINAGCAIMISSNKAEVKTNMCTFSNIENAVVNNGTGYYTDTGSVFTGVTGTTHIFYSGSTIGKAWLTGTVIKNAYYAGDGAGVNLINSGASISLTGVKFDSNTSDSKGGAIYISNNAVATIINCVFTNNKARTGSAIYILTSLSAVSTVTGSTFKSNVGQGIVYLLEGKIRVESSTFDSNISTTSPGIYSLLSTVTTVSCVFKNHACTQGCFVFAIAASSYTDTGSSFTNGNSSVMGSIIFAQSTTVSLSASFISSSTTTKEGALHILDSSTLSLTRVTFSNCLTNYGVIGGASVIHIQQSNLVISTASIENFNNVGIYVSSSDLIYIDGLSISNGNATTVTGGGLSCSDCTQVTILNSAFQNIASSEGGCLMFQGVNFANYTISNSRFQNCNSTMGGAIYSDSKGLIISNSNFTLNNAQKSALETSSTRYATGRGGALYLLCSDKLKCRSSIANSTFSNNTAYSNGGAICWEDFEPTFSNVNYSGNTAMYGSDLASFAVAVLPWVKPTSKRSLTTTISNVASGQAGGSPAIYMALYDKYNQIVTTDIVSTATLNSDLANTSLSGVFKMQVVNGTFSFDAYGITAKPGTNTQIYVTSDGIDPLKTETSATKTNIFVSVRDCILGEILTSANACLVCETNTYTLATNASYCTPCPSYAVCLKGALIYPQSGYWRSSNTTDTFFSCPRSSSCLGNENYSSAVGACAAGYTGHFCNTCESGYSRTSKNTCGACPDPSINGLRIGGITVGVVILIVFLVKSTMNSALRPKELTSVYLRILMNYLQLVMLTATFNLNWPSLVQSLLSTQESAGTATAQVFSFDCYMSDISTVNVLFQKLIMFFMMPGFIVIISFVFWFCVAIRRFNFAVMGNQMVATIIILLFLAHPNIVQTMFGMLSCTQVDPGQMWLVDDPSIRCWTGDHLFYTLTIALPGVAAWCLGIPTVALLLIVKNRRELNYISIKGKYGFLYNGYKPERYYWEFVIIYRKILIIFISVFVASISVDVQALSVMLVILVAFHLQHTYRPYAADELNSLELLSIFTSGVTIYSGLYFLTNDLNDATGTAFFFIIVTANGFFLTYWFFGINKAYMEKFAKLKPRIMAKLCGCMPSVLRVANTQIKNMDLQNFDVVENTYQKLNRTKEKKGLFDKKAVKETIIETAVENEESLRTIAEDDWMESDHALYIEICRSVSSTQRVRDADKVPDTLRPYQDKLEESTIIDLDSK